jgi:hypothetical protein
MKVIITESKLKNTIYKFLESHYDGFDSCWVDWGSYGCNLGECCDPYAIAFIPRNETSSDNYIFKLVDYDNYSIYGDAYPHVWQYNTPDVCSEYPDIKDPNFDTIILSENMYGKLKNFFGTTNMLKEPLLDLINEVFGLNATHITSD